MSFVFVLALQAASAQAEVSSPDLPRASSVLSRCYDDGENGAVVVCGSRPDRFRLPHPSERESVDLTQRGRGEAPTGMAALTAPGRCGMFQGERRCSKAEAAQYGYGQGRDSITLLTMLGTKLLDPDAEIGEPTKFPKK